MNSHNLIAEKSIPRNPAEFAVLGALYINKFHGYKLVKFLQDNLDEISWLGRSQTYALLAKLEQEALVTHERIEQMNFPARKVFSITQQGQDTLDNWILTPVPHLRDLRVEFMIKLFFARLRSHDIESKLLSEQFDLCKSKLARLVLLRLRASNRLMEDALDYRILMAQAACAWLESLIHLCSNLPNSSADELK
ncbi:MAG: PadR family transcriptional regulator [Desulfomonilaceae bacterium]